MPAAFTIEQIVRVFTKNMKKSIDKRWVKVYHIYGLAKANPKK